YNYTCGIRTSKNVTNTVSCTNGQHDAISHAGNAVTIYWQNVPGWTLQQNNNPANANGWSVNSSWTTSNGTNYLNVASPTGNLFFRLKQ
ncbi:MAG: hypothetical protein ACREFR_16510, partial [Limisphaerales bacterium]